MNKPITVFVDSGKAVARLSGPLVLGDTYAVAFSGLSTEEAAASPEMIVLGAKPEQIAARSGTDAVLAMTTKECVEAFPPVAPPPFPRPKEFPFPPPPPNAPLHGQARPHGAVRLHFYVVSGGQTLAQGDLPFLWAPFEYDGSGNPIVLKGDKGDKGEKGDKGDQGEAGRNGVYVAMDGLYAFHISQGGDHPEDGHLWIHAQDESTLYAKDQNGNYLEDSDGNRIPLYYIGPDGHLRYRFFYQDSAHVELDLGRVVTREGLYAFHVSDGTDGEPDGHLMLHGQNLAAIYATDANGDLILDGSGDPIPLFALDANGHLIYTFYGEDGEVHATIDIGDVRGPALTWADLTAEQKASLKGEKGDDGDKGDQGDPLTWADLTDEQKAALKGEKGDPGEDGMDAEEIVALVEATMGEADDAPTAGSRNWVTSGGLWSVEMAILARIAALKERIANIRADIAGAYHFKGSVDSYDELPTTDLNEGDVWNVRQDSTHPDGMNYAWTGSEWDALGGLGDLSEYLRIADFDTVLAATGIWSQVVSIGETASAAASAASDASSAASAAQQAASAAQSGVSSVSSRVGDIEAVLPASATSSNKLATIDDLNSVDVMGAALPTGVAGQNLGAWITTADSFFGTVPSPSDIMSQNADGNIYLGATSTNELTVPPSISGDQLALARAVAPGFMSSATYAVGSYVTHNGKLYRCTTAVSSAGDWTGSTNWEEVTVAQTKADSTSLAPAFSTSSTYAVGDYVTHDGLLYKCTTAVSTAGAWNEANWGGVAAMSEMPAPITVDSAMSTTSTNPVQNKVVDGAVKGRVPWANSSKNAVSIGPRTGNVGSGSLVVGASDNTASNSGSIAVGGNNTASGINGAAFGQQTTASSNNAFACGYRARAKHQDSFVWSGGTGYYDTTARGQFRINPYDGVSGFFIGSDSLASLLRYSLASPTTTASTTTTTDDTLSATLTDRAINTISVASGVTTLNLTFPEAVSGHVRDFFVRIVAAGTDLATVGLTADSAAADVEIGLDDLTDWNKAGTHLVLFTEVAAGKWLASKRLQEASS